MKALPFSPATMMTEALQGWLQRMRYDKEDLQELDEEGELEFYPAAADYLADLVASGIVTVSIVLDSDVMLAERMSELRQVIAAVETELSTRPDTTTTTENTHA